MRKIWRIFRIDAMHATKNVISLIVCVGLVVIPSLYAWFNIAGSWDPYGNTGNLKVAVANSDEGFQSDAIPVKINLGERVASDLSQKKTIGYVVTTEEDAIEGVRSGEYYAALVIPEDFTKDMLTVFSDDIQQATIVYYSNQKENAIAPIVTDKAATSVKNSIQTDFAQSLGEMGAGALSEISGYVSDDQLMDISKNLTDAISQASTDLRTVSSHMGVYSSLLSSAGSIIYSSSTLLSGTDSSTQDVRNALAESAQGVREVGDSVSTRRSPPAGRASTRYRARLTRPSTPPRPTPPTAPQSFATSRRASTRTQTPTSSSTTASRRSRRFCPRARSPFSTPRSRASRGSSPRSARWRSACAPPRRTSRTA